MAHDASELLRVSILDVQRFKDHMGKHGGVPKTINRRISSLSSFYRFLSVAAAELRLPITVPNPAHAQFIAREASDPVEETRALSETRARQLVAMVTGESLIDLRDRAILKFYLYTGARIETGCALNVSDFHQDGDEATVRFHLKGGRTKTKGIHFAAADAITGYVRAAGFESGPLFRPRRSPRTDGLAARRLSQRAMYAILMGYLERLPGAMRETALPSGETVQNASTQRIRSGRRPQLSCSTPESPLNPSRTCSTTSTSPPPRFTIKDGGQCATRHRTRCRFEVREVTHASDD